MTPREVELHDDAPLLITVAPRPTEHKKDLFLRDEVDDLAGLGLVRPPLSHLYASPVLMSLKQRSKKSPW